MSTTAYTIAGLLEKMDSPDKDFRFMATSDLMSELQKNNIKLDEDSERKVVRKLLKLLEDKNGEVQNLAVKCLGTLTVRVREAQAETMVDTLCGLVTSAKDELRDVSSIALKTVVTELSPAMSFTSNIVRRLAPLLAKALIFLRVDDRLMNICVVLFSCEPSSDAAVRMEMLDILTDILFRFGNVMSPHHSQLKDVLLNLLITERQVIKKRATISLGFLCSSCNTEIFTEIVGVLLNKLSTAKDDLTIRTFVNAVTYVTRASASRFSEYLSKVIPVFIEYSERSEDDELKEAVLQSFETFLLRCPREVAEYVPQIEKLVCAYLCHDPNYCGDYEDENMETSDEEEEEEDEYSDDDDMSWKVRRAASKAVEALIVSRREHLHSSINTLGLLLISRLREREENVRTDVFGAYIALLSQVSIVVPNPTNDLAKEGDDVVLVGNTRFAAGSLSEEQLKLLRDVESQVNGIVKSCQKLLRQKSTKTRQLCFDLLSQLIRTLPGALSSHFGSILPGVTATLSDSISSSQMKIDTLQFFALALSSHDPAILRPHLTSLVPLIAAAIGDNFYKVSSEAITLSDVTIPMLSQMGDSSLIQQLYLATLPKLKASDLDQEVKDKAIVSGGLFAAHCGDQLGNNLPELLSILFERCKNEVTRIVAIKSLETIAQSPLSIDLGSSNIQSILPLLAEFLKKNVRALKITTLSFLETILRDYKHSGVDCNGLSLVMNEVANLIKDDDLLVSQYALKCIGVALDRFPQHVSPFLPTVLQGFVQLTQSSLLQGPILNAALEMLKSLVHSNLKDKPSFEDLLDQLTSPVYDIPNLPKQSFYALSATTAVVAASDGNIEKTRLLCSKLAEQLANPHSTDSIRLYSLMALGELGRRCADVYTTTDIQPEHLIVEAFKSANEDLKTGAAYALGGMAVGNLPKFLPFILNQMKESKRQYLLLHALKEIILWETTDGSSIGDFRKHIEEIWPVLLKHAECAEEGTRNVVAECIGKLCVLEPELLQQLKIHVSSPSANVRAAVVTAIKFMITAEKKPIDTELHKLIGDFLSSVNDDDLNVRRVAFVALNSAAHNKPSLIRHLLSDVMPVVYGETKVRKELVKEVEMGPFKHTVDDGLDLRKAAFECMFTLLENCLEKLNIFEFITHLEDGLRDHHDIRLLAYITLSKLAILTPTHVLQRLDKICEPLKGQLISKMKSNAVKQEIEKHDELKRTAIRTWLALQEIPDSSRLPQLVDIQNTVRSTPELRTMLSSLEKDSQRSFHTGELLMDVSN